MQSIIEAKVRSEALARSLILKRERKEVLRHLEEVAGGAAFRGSPRSAGFLKYIVERTIAGDFDSLKERPIGVELFGRSPSYDTGDDAIVRVTASDVRKRLLQHYGKYGSGSAYRICLPLGCYIPEITRESTTASETEAAELPGVESATESAQKVQHPVGTGLKNYWKWGMVAGLLIGWGLVAWGVFGYHILPIHASGKSSLPWSVMFHGKDPAWLVTSDPNIAEIQGLTQSMITLSDYANGRYLQSPASISPQVAQICEEILRGDKAAGVDTAIVADIAEIAQANSRKISVHPARELRMADVESDANLIFLGSPRTNPWTSLYNDQLDFRFTYDNPPHHEIIQNVHPHHGESAFYVPTAKGFATGESFATISFVKNDQNTGHVLILAGENAEGTKAAGELVTDLDRLSAALALCGVNATGPTPHFQILLRLGMMAGTPRNPDVVACHILPDKSKS